MTPMAQLELLRLLQRHGVPFAIIGGHAVSFHGHIRATEDVDIVWLRSPAAEHALLQALVEAKAHWISDEIDPATRLERTVPISLDYIKANHLMMLITEYGFLDLFDYIPGVPQVGVQALYDSAAIAGDLRYASLDWLKRMKAASGRAKDLADLENLE